MYLYTIGYPINAIYVNASRIVKSCIISTKYYVVSTNAPSENQFLCVLLLIAILSINNNQNIYFFYFYYYLCYSFYLMKLC